MKRTRFPSICLITIIAIFAISRQTPAQFRDNMGGSWESPFSAYASTAIWANIEKNVMLNGSRKGGAGAKATGSKTVVKSIDPSANVVETLPVTTAQMNQAVQFKSSGTRLMLQAMTDKLGGTDDQKPQTSKLLALILDNYDQEAAKNGYPNDVALALASFIALDSAVYQEKTIAPDDKIVQVRNVIAQLAAEKGLLNGLDDRKRQETYEILVMSGGLTYIAYQDAKKRNSAAEMNTFKQLAGSNIKMILGMEPDTVNFTAESLSAANAQNSGATANQIAAATGNPINIGQLREDYHENQFRADQLYKGKRLLFRGIAQEVKSYYHKSNGAEEIDWGPNLQVVGNPDRIYDHQVFCFFKDKNQLAQIRHNQELTFEATVQGMEANYDLILIGVVLR